MVRFVSYVHFLISLQQGEWTYPDFPEPIKSHLWGNGEIQPSPKHLVSEHQTLARREDGIWGMAIGEAHSLCRLHIHLLWAIACPSSWVSIGLPVCWSVSHSWRLPAYPCQCVCLSVPLFICVSICLLVCL